MADIRCRENRGKQLFLMIYFSDPAFHPAGLGLLVRFAGRKNKIQAAGAASIRATR
jgi:hypothetical protein